MSSLPLVLALLVPAAPPREIDFDTQVVPVLTKAGCNAGACHGAAVGQGGFALSLWGSDPAADYRAIVRQLEGRRVNLARPDSSLVWTKPTGTLAHGGGVRLELDSPASLVLLDWLRDGAGRRLSRRLELFEVRPAETLAERVGEEVQLRATALFNTSVGGAEDVTEWTAFSSTDPASVEVDSAGRVTVLRRGQHTVIARFLDRVAAVRITAPFSNSPLDLSREPRHNLIDDEVLRTLAALRLPAAPPCDDATFLRRLSLDLTGTLPEPEAVREFLADRRDDKRERLVDRLLLSEEFSEYWTLFFARLLRLDSRVMDAAGVEAMRNWIHGHLAGHTAWNAMAVELLTGEGDSHADGPAAFARATPNAREQAEHTAQLFLGARLGCANCHNHPLDRWTQDDYHGLAAIFARLERGRIVRLGERGEVIHPRTGQAASPRLPGERFLAAGGDHRGELARWITAPENPSFARAMVNRLWKAMFGSGLVEPVDDLRDTNPATHPALLTRLAEDFSSHGYDPRHTLRRIATSATYERGSSPLSQASPAGSEEVADDRFFSVFPGRPLAAEVLSDAVAAVTGVASGEPAITLVDAAAEAPSLVILGRCPRDRPCAEEAAGDGLSRALHLLNGPLVNEKLTSPKGRLARLLADGRSDDEILDDFYLRALGRLPRDGERAFWRGQWRDAADSSDRQRLWQDILWGLLSCQEFVTNH